MRTGKGQEQYNDDRVGVGRKQEYLDIGNGKSKNNEWMDIFDSVDDRRQTW